MPLVCTLFQFPAARPTAAGEGFKTQVRDGIELSLGPNQRIDVALELGAVTETIEVTGDVSLIQTDESSTGATIRTEIKDNLAQKGRRSSGIGCPEL